RSDEKHRGNKMGGWNVLENLDVLEGFPGRLLRGRSSGLFLVFGRRLGRGLRGSRRPSRFLRRCGPYFRHPFPSALDPGRSQESRPEANGTNQTMSAHVFPFPRAEEYGPGCCSIERRTVTGNGCSKKRGP